jgi:hypothetical protein
MQTTGGYRKHKVRELFDTQGVGCIHTPLAGARPLCEDHVPYNAPAVLLCG